LEQSDVILVGVSRSGKTPTSLYLAMQYGLKASNYPLIPRTSTAGSCLRHWFHANRQDFWTDHPARALERNSQRASAQFTLRVSENCRHEVSEAEAMMRRAGIRWLSTTTKSIEEIATTILQELHPERLAY